MSRRLLLELLEHQKNPTPFGNATPVGEDLNKWTIVLVGPSSTPYSGGIFRVKVRFPEEYPFKPPTVKFLTKIYHPNVTASSGEVCPELLTENWKPHLNIRYIMECLRTLLICPNPTNPLDEQIGLHYIENRDEFNALAEKWTKMHATQI
jgi:ubiquitin-protein ligase